MAGFTLSPIGVHFMLVTFDDKAGVFDGFTLVFPYWVHMMVATHEELVHCFHNRFTPIALPKNDMIVQHPFSKTCYLHLKYCRVIHINIYLLVEAIFS